MIQLLCLNYIISNGDKAFIADNNLDESFFSDYKEEFKFIKSHLSTYGVVPDMASVVNQFHDFQIVGVKESPRFLLEELWKDKNKRELATAFNKIASLVNADKVDEAMSFLAKEYVRISSSRGMQCVDILKDKSRYKDYIERSEDYKKFYVTTGFVELDEILGGWDRKEELVTMAARLGTGKTWLMLKCATAAAKAGLKVGIYSGEMSDKKIGYRVDTLLSHISNSRIMHGDRSVQNEYKLFLDGLDDSVKGTILVITPKMLGGQANVSTLGSFIDKEGLDMLCVDQHSLMDDERKGRSITERAANISADLKKLQELKQIPIIAVAQQNREEVVDGEESKNIGLSDRIGQDSTVIIMFDKKDDVMTLSLVKSRDASGQQKLKYAVDFDRGVFTYLPNEDDALSGADSDSLRQEFEYDGDTSPF